MYRKSQQNYKNGVKSVFVNPRQRTKKMNGSPAYILEKDDKIEYLFEGKKTLLTYKELLTSKLPEYVIHYGGSQSGCLFYKLLLEANKYNIETLVKGGRHVISTFLVNSHTSFVDLFRFVKGLELDSVEKIQETFEALNQVTKKTSKQDLINFFSYSDLAYYDWTRDLDCEIEIPNDKRKVYYISQACYGARNYPTQRLFQSKAKFKTHQELLDSGDFAIAEDVTSLYGAAMAGFTFMNNIEYPLGFSEFVSNAEEEFKKGTMGIYNRPAKKNQKQ
jgi:hypothetical protein